MVFMLLNRPTRLSHHITLWNCFICWLFSYIYFIVLLLLPPPPPPLVHLFIQFDCIEKMHGLFYVNKWNIPAGECCLSSHHIKSNQITKPYLAQHFIRIDFFRSMCHHSEILFQSIWFVWPPALECEPKTFYVILQFDWRTDNYLASCALVSIFFAFYSCHLIVSDFSHLQANASHASNHF